MDILKRIDFVQQFAKEYADGAWSIDVDQWKRHVTPELIEDIRQYIVSMQLKLIHEQTAQSVSNEYVAYVEQGGFIVERNDVSLSPGMKLYAVSGPAPTSVSLSKRAELEADGYVVNGVALMHPETRRRVLLDYCGFVGWWHGQVHPEKQAQQTDTVDAYATPEESASVTRQATPFESWLDAQLNRIHPQRHEMGSAGDMPAMTILVHKLKHAQTEAEGEAAVMCSLLEECIEVISTIDPESDDERWRLEYLQRKIKAAVKFQFMKKFQ